LLGYWLETLAEAGVERIVVNLHHLPEQVIRFIDSSPQRDRVVTVFEEHLVGTGGSILKHREHLDGAPFMVIHSDNLSRFDVPAFIERHRRRPPQCEMTMMTFDTDAPQSCGIVELDSAGVVVSFREKPSTSSSRLANGAVYILEPSMIRFLEGLGKETIDFSTEVIPRFVRRTFAFHNDHYHRDIGNMASYLQAQVDTSYLR
jgi:mannose-1-phosphate guanylyltransferase